jgi:hypothetical protein
MTPTGSPARSRWLYPAVCLLLLAYVWLAASASWSESNTYDEALHLTTGYLRLAHPGEKVWPDLGVFAQEWAALPLLFDGLRYPVGAPSSYREMGEWEQGFRFFYTMGNDPTTMLRQARFMISLLGAALGALVFAWSRRLFGDAGGLLSLSMFVLCPNMLAHGSLVTADMAAALGFVAATFCFWNASHEVSWRNLLCSFLALGCLTLSKLSSIAIFPILVLLILVRVYSRRPVEIRIRNRGPIGDRRGKAWALALVLLAHAAAVVAVLWIAYDFNYLSQGEAAAWQRALASPAFPWWSGPKIRALVFGWLFRLDLLPHSYLEGLSFQFRALERGGYVLGQRTMGGTWWFFPLAFLVKTPISTLALIGLSAAAFALGHRGPRKNSPAGGSEIQPGLYSLSPLLILGGVYGAACLTSNLNIGLRHLLPLYPVLFILAGANAYWLRRFGRQGAIGLGILVAGLGIESFAVRPHYLAFFNLFTGGPRYGYHYLVDSSLDWGQDLPGLRKWLDRNVPAGGGTEVYLCYFGTAEPRTYGIQAHPLPNRFGLDAPIPYPLKPGIYCISATCLEEARWTRGEQAMYWECRSELDRLAAATRDTEALQALVRQTGEEYWNAIARRFLTLQSIHLCAYLRQREPDDEVGYSILIYRLNAASLKAGVSVEPLSAPLSAFPLDPDLAPPPMN